MARINNVSELIKERCTTLDSCFSILDVRDVSNLNIAVNRNILLFLSEEYYNDNYNLIRINEVRSRCMHSKDTRFITKMVIKELNRIDISYDFMINLITYLVMYNIIKGVS